MKRRVALSFRCLAAVDDQSEMRKHALPLLTAVLHMLQNRRCFSPALLLLTAVAAPQRNFHREAAARECCWAHVRKPVERAGLENDEEVDPRASEVKEEVEVKKVEIPEKEEAVVPL